MDVERTSSSKYRNLSLNPASFKIIPRDSNVRVTSTLHKFLEASKSQKLFPKLRDKVVDRSRNQRKARI